MGCSVWKSPEFSNSSKDIQVTTCLEGCKSCVVHVGGRGGESIDTSALMGVCPRVLCRICCFSSQLCICPQVSSCLSACYDVSAALVRCFSVTENYPTSLPSCLSTCVSRCMCRGVSLSSLAPSHTQPCPSLGPLPFSLGPVAGLWVAIVTVAKSLRLIASDGAVGSIHKGG